MRRKMAAFGVGALLAIGTASARAEEVRGIANWGAPPFWSAPAPEREAPRGAVPAGVLSPESLPTAPLPFVAITPCRLADTRAGQGFSGAFGPPRLVANTPRTFPVAGYCGVGATAKAVSANITVVLPSAAGFLSFYPSGTTWPGNSNINFSGGAVIANTAIVPLGSDGGMNVIGNAATDLIIDVNGYYAPAAAGTGNTALGDGALQAVTTGTDNVGVGARALGAITDSKENVAVGAGALSVATVGPNTGVGFNALGANVNGTNNTAFGWNALSTLTAGQGNIAIGKGAGANLSAGNNNIYIGNPGSGVDGSYIRIGDVQTRAFVAGIFGATVSGGAAVYVDSNGQLGTVNSSRRYKADIEDVGDATAILEQLRPVSFRYVSDPSGARQYGLIAEEVARVAPELVIFDKDGRPETVKYHLVNALLLAQVQRLEARLKALEETIRELREQRAGE